MIRSLLLPVGLLGLLLGSAPASAQEPTAAARSSRHAALLVDAASEVDAFTKMYLYEVISGRLQQLGFAVTAGDPGAASRPALQCVESAECRAPLMQTLHAPWLIAVHLQPSGEGRLRVSLRTSDGSARLDAEDEEAAIATALDRALSSIDASTIPCLVVLDSEVRNTEFRLRGETTTLPSLVVPGEHDARLDAPGRHAWEGSLVCRGGGVLRVRVR
ncbi:MAG: hypothetical protein AB8I08_26965 [Sandaracinaceae bacterium]